ncbi:hypothetical protein [Clostridium cibarium]|nr:hypothetical protein [Clostridium cibarium]
MAIEGLHNVQILRGLQTNRSLLSCTADGSEINLWSIDDGMGR